jgi:hypothetical protein
MMKASEMRTAVQIRKPPLNLRPQSKNALKSGGLPLNLNSPPALETILRIHLFQQCFGLSNPGMEEALHATPL